MSWATLLVTVLPLLVAWKLYSLTSKRLAYDLHKIPSPPGWPLLGNIGQLYGTNNMARVSVMLTAVSAMCLNQQKFAFVNQPHSLQVELNAC